MTCREMAIPIRTAANARGNRSAGSRRAKVLVGEKKNESHHEGIKRFVL